MIQPFLPRYLQQANDVEANPGPRAVLTNGPASVATATTTARSEQQIKRQSHHCTNGVRPVPAITAKVDPNPREQEPPPAPVHPVVVYNKMQQQPQGDGEVIKTQVERHQELLRIQREDLDDLRRLMEQNARITQDFKAELSEIRKNWQSLNGGSETKESVNKKVDDLTAAYNDIQDRLYEIDKSWKNNLVVYGIPCSDNMDEDPLVTEDKVRDVLHKKLHISREIPMNRIARIWHGPEFRGHKPIQLCIVNYRDKEEILRKARLLKGSNIYISEDFSRKVREHRHELIKFMKEVRSRDPTRRMTLRYDKLYMGNDVFFFNDRTGRVERMHSHLDLGTSSNALIGNLIINDSQNSSHDPSWLRRPRSRLSHSPSRFSSLSRQNSISMDDVNVSPTKGILNRSGRGVTSARSRRPPVAKSVSVDSLDYDSDSAINGDRFNYGRPNEYYYENRDGGTPSPTKGRGVKTVAFKDVPEVDKETPRMLNGTPHHNPYQRPMADDYPSDDEVVMTVDTVNRTYSQSFKGDDSRAVAILPPSQMVQSQSTPLPPLTNQAMPLVATKQELVPNGYHHHQPPPQDQSQNLPALLHSSIGKLHMNFVQNKSIEAEPRPMLGYDGSAEVQHHVATPIPATAVAAHHDPALAHNGTNGHTNGVLKVAMYGEFPINGQGSGQPYHQQQLQHEPVQQLPPQ